MAEPITTAELKAHLRISHSTQDSYLETLIATAREEVERDTWRGLIDRDGFEIALRCFPDRSNDDQRIYFPHAPLRAVASVTYRDPSGNEIELDESAYVVDTRHTPGSIEPAPGTSWPGTQDHPEAVLIVCEVGYEDAGEVPTALKHAIKLIAGELFQAANPTPLAPAGGGTGAVRTTLDRLLEKWRVRHAGILDCV